MKKIKSLVCVILSLLTVAVALCACNVDEPPQQTQRYVVRYGAGEGGYIVGSMIQVIVGGQSSEEVTAMPEEGYMFIGWSDGVPTAKRKEKRITADAEITACFEKVISEVVYCAGEHGSISGETRQKLAFDEMGTPVKAIPDDGYEFVNWSDGVRTAERTDVGIDRKVFAYFTEYTRIFKVNYGFGESILGEKDVYSVKLNKSNYRDVTLPKLKREHFTFDGWYVDDTKIADESGKIVSDLDFLTSESQKIYARWKANETFTYKILLVYVTETDADLLDRYGNATRFKYKMDDFDLEFCKLTTTRLKYEMDAMLEGLVDFQIDEYYTKVPIITENINRFAGYNSLDAENIPEVKDLILEYDSALAVWSVGDSDIENQYNYYQARGQAGMRFGGVRLDGYLQTLNFLRVEKGKVLEAMREGSDHDVKVPGLPNFDVIYDWIGLIIHELTHTIELRMNLYDYHNILYIYQCRGADDRLRDKVYYHNEAAIGTQKYGIPYEFWKYGAITANYKSLDTDGNFGGGRVFSKRDGGYCRYFLEDGIRYNINIVSYGVIYGEFVTAFAEPLDGYEFVGWSDGITTYWRTDHATEEFEATALFRKITA